MGSDLEIKLEEVNDGDITFLYDLLKKRDPNQNISHKNMPTLIEHEKFVLSNNTIIDDFGYLLIPNIVASVMSPCFIVTEYVPSGNTSSTLD